MGVDVLVRAGSFKRRLAVSELRRRILEDAIVLVLWLRGALFAAVRPVVNCDRTGAEIFEDAAVLVDSD